MQNALVIGGLSGVGKGITASLVKKGFNVIVGDQHVLNKDKQMIGDVLHLYVDADNDESVNTLYKNMAKLVDHIDMLIITIGAIDEGSIQHLSEEKWKWAFNANLFSNIRLVDALLPLIKKSERGRIMLTSSTAAFGRVNPQLGLGLYSITKHALLGYFRSLHNELREEGIFVSLLIPSGVKGKLAENSAAKRHNLLHESSNNVTGKQPKGRNLVAPELVGDQFVNDFLNDKVFITNNPELVMQSIDLEYQFIQKSLKK
ncbi:SDR family oxidoreductase [Bacillus spongiae]|uniref:SDR family oxidoreductase n=1 Tax=Bacillus spongiae TaxID=2683610 RepID=A0ABU8HIP4_9BACI